MWTNFKNPRRSVVGVLVMAGCGVDDAQEGASGDAGSSPPADTADDDQDMVLDLETGQAETEAGTVQAQRADHSYVTAIGESRAIGITTAGDFGATPDPTESDDQLVVYVYDRDQLAVLTGPPDDDGTASLTSGELADFDATVDLSSVTDDAVSGTLTIADETPVEFTADAATGDAGVYWAHGATDDPDVTCVWVVLPDSSHWAAPAPRRTLAPAATCTGSEVAAPIRRRGGWQ